MKQLGLFAKYWEPGHVKTRLARSIGEQLAAQLHREFLATTARRFLSFPADRVVTYWPPDKQPEFKALLGSRWRLKPQVAGDLGQRMQHHVAEALDMGYHQVVLVGADSPTLSTQLVEQAFDELKDHDVVLGPARDGGYYLIGCTAPIPGLFEGVAWGSGQVLAQTIQKLKATGVHYATLPEWYDIDQLEDLVYLQQDLAHEPHQEPGDLRLAQLVNQAIRQVSPRDPA